ncbi:MAG: galactose oxidase early set domain-containing protein [Actinomycetota bacterium]|nr:galactose oxidase early set domain-containing protein [Actinomycetota bacterium]
MLRRVSVALALLTIAALLPSAAVADGGGKAVRGSFGKPFEEPTIQGRRTKDKCVTTKDGTKVCKPTAGTISVLPSGKLLYFNALEGTENVQNSIGAEYGQVSINDQTRVLNLSGTSPRWTKPRNNDGGANLDGNKSETYLPNNADDTSSNDGSLFCADLSMLPDGRILAVGGTDYYSEPGLPGQQYGFVELEGLKQARIYDPKTNRWEGLGDDMEFGRWYPTLVTLANGDQFVASGVTKLIKPVYPNRPADSGTNVKQTETLDRDTMKWTTNPSSANRSLPLFPRLHLLPNGHVYYNVGGQTFNPQGQSYDEALWNIAASYDPKTQEWSDLGVPGLGTANPGFRGSSFSVMLPLKANRDGKYTKSRFLSAGGVLGTSPGAYIANTSSLLTTVKTSGNTVELASSKATGPLNHARWYASGVLLPDGSVLALSGADRDEVVFPGSGFPVTEAELFDPKTKTWKRAALQNKGRTYHNTAVLLPDARVLVGGHAPIPTGYGKNMTMPGGFSENDGRDPSFEIYKPPYLFRGERPSIAAAPSRIRHGRTFQVKVDGARKVDSVVLVRNATMTHLVDADQRNVELDVVRRNGGTLTVAAPPNRAVAPPGQYMLFVNKATKRGPIPSVSEQVRIN